MKKWLKKVLCSQTELMFHHIFDKDKRPVKAAIFFLTAIVSVSSCKKVENELGGSILPSDDQLFMYVDTFQVDTWSIREDSIPSDEFSNNLIGTCNDPVVGKTSASIYTQVRLSAFNPDFDVPNTVVDSVVLSLRITGHYGNSNPQTFMVYQLSDTIDRESHYYTNTVKPDNTINLVKPGFATFTPSTTAKPVIDGDTLDPQMRIRLEESFGTMIVNADSVDLASDDNFDAFMKGLRIVTDTNMAVGEGGVYSIDLEHAESNVTIYYHDLTDTSKFVLNINDKCARFTHMEHNYNGTAVAQQLADSTLGNSFYYLQAGQGLLANVAVPTLLDLLSQGNIAINKAELYLPVQHYTIDPFAPPTRIIAYGLDDEGEIYNLPDFGGSTSSFGGNYDEDTKAYKFNIPRYIQDVIKGDVSNNPIRIAAAASSVSVNRVVLSGRSSTNREKPYLKVYYTKY